VTTQRTLAAGSARILAATASCARGWLEKIGKLDFSGGALASEAAKRLQKCEALLDGTPNACSTRMTKTDDDTD
jgi:hypothetical protein